VTFSDGYRMRLTPAFAPYVLNRIDQHLVGVLFGTMVRSANVAPPICQNCGLSMKRLGTLPKIGLFPRLYIYLCRPCRAMMSVEPKVITAAA
jgi:hypothetical protein